MHKGEVNVIIEQVEQFEQVEELEDTFYECIHNNILIGLPFNLRKIISIYLIFGNWLPDTASNFQQAIAWNLLEFFPH